MSRETKYTAIVLKKQPFNEGDEIITFFTKELGKVRALAKSIKLAKSKMQQRLQSLFVVDLVLTHGKLPRIIFAQPQEVFAGLREDLPALKNAFYAAELVLKFTGDEHKNEQLFDLLIQFLKFLNFPQKQADLGLGLATFKLKALNSLGLNLLYPNTQEGAVYFSPHLGGFVSQKSYGALAASPGSYRLFLELSRRGFDYPPALYGLPVQELQNLLSQFIEYQMERKLKSESYLNQQ